VSSRLHLLQKGDGNAPTGLVVLAAAVFRLTTKSR
jgi:hypothetical protein